MFNKKFRHWLDSNRGPLESEVTALPTGPRPSIENDRDLIGDLSSVNRFEADDKDDGDRGEVAGNEHQEAGMIFAVAVASLQEVGIVV